MKQIHRISWKKEKEEEQVFGWQGNCEMMKVSWQSYRFFRERRESGSGSATNAHERERCHLRLSGEMTRVKNRSISALNG